ncbi:hypothetical protein [Streptomyces sp. LBL]|uniref:hypothetical protein n=1 Tax=Streptomyces sp. LBL TaxID=2940562 RepID=UPI0024761D02|nr:hypothetical protein [Streptomyces sp. LBL]
MPAIRHTEPRGRSYRFVPMDSPWDLTYMDEVADLVRRGLAGYDAMTDGESGIATPTENVTESHNDVPRIHPDLSIENTKESPWTSPV